MMGPLLPILVLVLIGVAFWAGRMSAGVGTTPAAAPTAPSRDLAERDAFIEQLRELAWQHRDVSPELSTIIIDEIQTHHRRISRGPDA
ncbi:hypothetical protein L2K70_03005 [Nocardioides KLBMP 9356]|uniref:Uncharacterized protein n=1 Tax=Nocardioides potassii TaxID=2911371 RepID=A0ABS9H5M5_9ACTN|nr:hypothetical protein [Nocardioides potassii]MCF6376560.1 hypothetical protein [Nocardioides potassii]